MCELARALINRGWSINIATFSIWDLQEQCRKSYVASLILDERRIGDLTNVFLRTMSMKVIHEVFFCERFPIFGVWQL